MHIHIRVCMYTTNSPRVSAYLYVSFRQTQKCKFHLKHLRRVEVTRKTPYIHVYQLEVMLEADANAIDEKVNAIHGTVYIIYVNVQMFWESHRSCNSVMVEVDQFAIHATFLVTKSVLVLFCHLFLTYTVYYKKYSSYLYILVKHFC